MEDWIYIVLGVALPLLAGIFNKKKDNQPDVRPGDDYTYDEHTYEEDAYEGEIVPETASEKKKASFWEMIDAVFEEEKPIETEIPIQNEYSFRDEVNRIRKEEEVIVVKEEEEILDVFSGNKKERKHVIDKRNLILYSELLKPKFKES